ncbi:MAG: SDR family oxidoreductase [Solirubrobacterales bacterium]|nr:SDR family oxidoreductase [Solirubrobacterales bacterium]
MLLTGATGFVGMELLARVLEHTDREVIALVRADDDEAAQARLDAMLVTLLAPGERPAAGRVRAVAADLEQPGLGLAPAARDRVAGQAEAIVHCAASISFSLPLDEARQVNVDGTREVLRLAEETATRGTLERVVHVSTAYVAGEREGRVRERQGDVGQGFRNTYERTKLEAEGLVHESGLPVAILRPSIVVGDSVTGWTPAFNVIYWPLQAFARGLLSTLPSDPDGRVDIVPVDVVADALLALLEGPLRRGAFHAVAGDGAPTCATLARMAAEAFGVPTPEFVAPGEDPAAEEMAGVMLPYFRVRCVFDALRGRALGACPPPLADYFPALMRYADDARWGKKSTPRWAPAGEELTPAG